MKRVEFDIFYLRGITIGRLAVFYNNCGLGEIDPLPTMISSRFGSIHIPL